MKAGWILLPALLLMSANAWGAEVYCNGSPFRLRDEGEVRLDWYVVNMKARKVQMPGQKTPTTGCSYMLDSIGALTGPIEVIQRPKLGQAMTSIYQISYRSAKNGEDAMTVRIHRLSTYTGRPATMIVHFDIHVVDHPL